MSRTVSQCRSQSGHIEIGYTLAIWVILIGFFALNYVADGEPMDMWLGWPWWAQALSVACPVVVVILGGLFEKSRQWPKT